MEPSENGLSIEWTPPHGRGLAGTVVARLAEETYTDRLDILRPAARVGLLDELGKRWPALDTPDHRRRLKAELERLAVGEAARGTAEDEGANDGQPDPQELLDAMPEGVRLQARAMLESPSLMIEVVEDVGALGVAGEKELRAALYLIGTSRLLLQPLAAIVQGPSSSGKSYIIDRTASLFPPETVIQATQMTPQALFHMRPGSLKNRFVVAGERARSDSDEQAEATRALREMLSAGRLVKLMPVKENGEIRTVSIEQEGPISYVESTSLGTVFAEDANRCLLLTTDERPEQTRKIIDRLAVAFSGAEAARVEDTILKHHAAQRMLQPFGVVVPFAERLGELVAHDRVEARRAFPQLVGMIQTSALLHQRQRSIDAGGRLLAHQDDYELARHLLLIPVARQLGRRLSDPAERFLQRLRAWYGLDDVFTGPDAAHREPGCPRSVRSWLHELLDAGHVDQVEEARGRAPAKWRVRSDRGPTDEAVTLPTVEQLFPPQ